MMPDAIGGERYRRLEALPSIGAAGMATLRSARVALVGVGNIGGQLATHLGLLGLGLVLVDRDVVAEANLGTQGFAERDVGRPKAVVRAEQIQLLNPTCRVDVIHADIEQLGLAALRGSSLIASCLDNRPSRLIVNEMSMRLGIPWIDGAIDGSGRSWFGRVACYDPRVKGSACYLCPFDAAALRDLSLESSRDGFGCRVRPWHRLDRTAAAPTLASSALGGAVASIQAIWALHILLGQGDRVSGQEIYFDLGQHRLSTHRLTRNPRCLLDHLVWPLSPLASAFTKATVGDTFRIAEAALGHEVELHLVRRRLATRLRCARCGEEHRPYRLVEALDERETLCGCGEDLQCLGGDFVDRFGRADAVPFLEQTWAAIGLPPADVVVASSGEHELHFCLCESTG